MMDQLQDIDYWRRRAIAAEQYAARLEANDMKEGIVRHVKRQTTYRILGKGLLMVSGGRMLGDETPLTFYQQWPGPGRLFGRETSEFEDGRFQWLKTQRVIKDDGDAQEQGSAG